jgi:hypothetical protein
VKSWAAEYKVVNGYTVKDTFWAFVAGAVLGFVVALTVFASVGYYGWCAR